MWKRNNSVYSFSIFYKHLKYNNVLCMYICIVFIIFICVQFIYPVYMGRFLGNRIRRIKRSATV